MSAGAPCCAVADRDINLGRPWTDNHVFDGYLGATDLLRKKRLEVEEVEGSARWPLRCRWKRDRVDAGGFPVSDE